MRVDFTCSVVAAFVRGCRPLLHWRMNRTGRIVFYLYFLVYANSQIFENAFKCLYCPPWLRLFDQK